MTRVHKDLRDLADAARKRGAEVVCHGGTYFSVLKDGQEVTRLTAARSTRTVPAVNRRKIERALRDAGLLDEKQPYAPHPTDLQLSHGTRGIIQAAERSRTSAHVQRDGSGLMPVEEVVGILQAAVVKEGKGAKHRGGFLKVARAAVKTARERSLPPPATRGDTADPWDERRIAEVLGKFIGTNGRGAARSIQFFRAHAEELVGRLDTFVLTDSTPEPAPEPEPEAFMPDPPSPLDAPGGEEPPEEPDEPELPAPEREQETPPAVFYEEVIALSPETTIGRARELIDQVKRHGGEAAMDDDGVLIRVGAADLWDLRETLIAIGPSVTRTLAVTRTNAEPPWRPDKGRVTS